MLRFSSERKSWLMFMTITTMDCTSYSLPFIMHTDYYFFNRRFSF